MSQADSQCSGKSTDVRAMKADTGERTAEPRPVSCLLPHLSHSCSSAPDGGCFEGKDEAHATTTSQSSREASHPDLCLKSPNFKRQPLNPHYLRTLCRPNKTCLQTTGGLWTMKTALKPEKLGLESLFSHLLNDLEHLSFVSSSLRMIVPMPQGCYAIK